MHPAELGRKNQLAAIERMKTEKKRHEIAELYVGGMTQRKIAEKVGLSLSAVGKHLAEIRRKWEQDVKEWMTTAKAEQLMKIDRLEEEAWDAWRRSREDAVTRTVETEKHRHEPFQPDEDEEGIQEILPARLKTQKKKEVTQARGQVGDAKFLEVIQWCVEQRCKILGLTKTGTTINAPVQINWAGLLEAQQRPQESLNDRIRQMALAPPGFSGKEPVYAREVIDAVPASDRRGREVGDGGGGEEGASAEEADGGGGSFSEGG